MSLLKDVEHLKIPLEEIKMATNNFSQQNLIRTIDFGYEYKGELSRFKGQTVVVKRLDSSVAGHRENEFLTEIMVLYYYSHENIVSLVGFCNEGDEKIIVYEHQSHGSLDNHLSSINLTWMQRLQICLGAARGLRYLHHDDVGSKDGVLHRDIRSSNILLNDEFEAKISGLELSTINPANKQFRFLISRARGPVGYIDPQYIKTGTVNDKSDVYSFGVVLFEVLCGRMSLNPNSEKELRFLPPLAQRSYEEGKLDEIIHQDLRKQMDPNSLKAFSDLAYHCLKEQRVQRPNMDQVVKRLEKALQLQREFETPAEHQRVAGLSNEYSNSQDTPESHYKVKNLQHLRIPLKDIESATGDFDKKNHIGDGAYGSVYKAELFHFDERNLVEEKGASVLSMKELCAKPKRCSTVAIKRLVRTKNGQGEKEFLTEIEMLSCYKHPNVVSLLGFCDEGDELILVYEYASNGSLDTYLGKDSMIPLTWTRRLQICLDAAQGLNYLHTGVGEKYRIIHRDVKSSNILLGQNWEAKISDFGLSRISPANQLATFLMIDVAGTLEYLDPQYLDTRRLTKASDVFSFGVVLFEVLSGRLAFEEDNDDKLFLAHLAQHCFEQEKLDEITDPKLREEMEQNFSILDAGADGDSLNTFSAIAYQCLRENQAERPTMAEVIGQLQKALEFQVKRVEVLKISLEKIKSATNNFSEHNLIGRGGFGSVYLGELSLPGCNTVAVKRLDTKLGQGKIEFLSEITMLYNHQHENIIPLIGFCDEENEEIIIYEHAFHGSLDRHLNDAMVTWICRLKICIGAARALDYLHSGAGTQHRVIHRDVKSGNILLNHDWEAKISDFGLSRICPRNQEIDYVITNPAGTFGYIDPLYFKTGMLTKEADVYSFGVVLFEILCGRLVVAMAFDHKQPFSWPAELAKLCLENKNLDEIVDCNIREQIELNSLNTFSTITYQCLREQREERPTMAQVVKELEKALEFQEDSEWEKKLPRDYEEIIKMSKSPLFYSTKKELYSRLSSGILLREGKVWFSLSMGGAKNEMTSATEFSYKNYKFHKWRSAPKSRFPKAAKMLDVSNLKIQIKITTQFLSPEIVYGAYLVFKFCDQRKISSGPMYVNLKYKMADEFLNAYFAEKRDDDWMMIEMCRFINHKKTADFEVLLESLSRYYCGSGAIFVEGIEFRAIHNMEHGGNVIKYETDVVESSGNVDEDQHLLCDYQEMIKRSNNYCVRNTSDEELYFLRSKGILIEKGEKLFFPTNANGKKCHMLSAKVILHDSSNVKYFDWKPLPQYRFVEVAELLSCQLFRIKYNVETQLLSPDTAYGCYLVYKLSERCRGLHCPVKSRDLLPTRKKNDTKGEHDLLHPKKKKEDQIVYFRSPSQVNLHKFTKVPNQREDGWMEVRVWEFITEAELKNDYHPMDLKLISYEGNMRGLIVCAIQFRPI